MPIIVREARWQIGLSSASGSKGPGSNLEDESETMHDLRDSKYTPYCWCIFVARDTISWVYIAAV